MHPVFERLGYEQWWPIENRASVAGLFLPGHRCGVYVLGFGAGAIRRFNLGLMRKGPCLNSRSHCFDLADRLLEADSG